MRTHVRSAGALAAALSLAAAAPALAQAPRGELPLKRAPQPTTSAITPADAMTRVYVLADDSMMGREAGTAGNVKGTDYIAREARRMGLEPAGENGTFFQTIPLRRKGVDPASALSINGSPLRLGEDFIAIPTIESVFSFGDSLRASNVQVVYGGRLGTLNLINPAQAAGKLVVFDAAQVNGARSWRFWTGGSFDRYASSAGVVIAALDAVPENIRGFLAEPQEALVDPAAPRRHAASPAGLLVTVAAAERLLGKPLSAAAVGDAGRTVSGTVWFADTPSAFPARNVVAVLRGTDPRLRGQYVAIGAHNDHVGTAPEALDHDSLRVFNGVLRRGGLEGEAARATPAQEAQIRARTDSLRRAHGGVRRDSIFNGADDDASGTTGVLEIAEYLAAHRPKRSVLFVWHTGEEKGLLGSQWFTEHPSGGIVRDSIVAQLNMDMIGRGAATDETGASKDSVTLHGGPGYVQLVGSRRLSTQLGDLVEEVNRTGNHGLAFDYALDANRHPANIYCRSDHYNYARWGIPITFFTTGGHQDYHMLTDEPEYIDYDKLVQVSRFVADVAEHIANRPDRLVVDKPKPDPHGDCSQ
ncbi:MAG TPA: M28 family peptidase [Longimicrobium sp.]